MNELKEFEETVAYLGQTVESDAIYETFKAGEVEQFRKAVNVMRDHIRRAVEQGGEEQVCVAAPSAADTDLVSGTLQIIERAFLVRRLPDTISQFIDKYVLLAFNWNKLACSDRVAEGVQAVLNLMNYHQSVVETTKVLRYLIRETRGILEFKPPVFELSRHYLQAIQERIKEV